MAAAGKLGKLAPAGHNLAGVGVPVGAGLGTVDIPSRVAADMARYVVHSYLGAGMACSALEAHMVVEAHDIAVVDFEREHSVSGHVVEVEHSQAAHEVDVCYVPAGSEECYVPDGCFVKEVHFVDCFGFAGEWEVPSHSAQVCSAEEHEFVVILR